MKPLTIIIVIILFATLTSCNKKPEPKLEFFNPEAFAFDLGDSWEVNATINAKGFKQKENNNKYFVKLFYTVDLITNKNDTLKKIFIDTLANNQKNEFIDIPVEAQIELDSTFETGNYKLLFNIIDGYSEQAKTAEVNFKLTKD